MTNAIQQIASALNRLDASTITISPETVATANPLTLVGAENEQITVRQTRGWAPRVNEQVLTIRSRDGDVWAIGPVSTQYAPPVSGTVMTVDGSLVTVDLGEPFGQVPMPSTVPVTSGDNVGIAWGVAPDGSWNGWIGGVLLASPGAPPPPPAPPEGSPDRPGGGALSGTLEVRARDTYTWRQGWRSDTRHLYQGNAGAWSSYPYPQSGFWFYGAGAFDDLGGQTVSSLRIKVKVMDGTGSGGAVPVNFHLHSNTTRPGGYPTVVSAAHSVSLGPGQHTVTLPTSWGQSLVDGSASGIAIISDSTAEYRGVHGLVESSAASADAQSGHLTISTT